jgi:hypothetical protein
MHPRTLFYTVCGNGHSFCVSCVRRLADTCPVCREDRVRDRVEDLSRKTILTALYQEFLRDLQTEWGEVDAMDCDFVWYDAKIMGWDGKCFLVHFYGWDHKWDEWISDPHRIAPHRTHTTEWISTLQTGQAIEFKKKNEATVWFLGTIVRLDRDRGVVYVENNEQDTTYQVSWDKDWLSPVGVHILVWKGKKKILQQK